jgi:hypothetical protein
MIRTFVTGILGIGFLTLATGCVEMTQTITLNPDGRGKVKIEVVTAAFDELGGALMGGGEQKKKTPAEMKAQAAAKFVTDAAGVTAFKDVSASWTREGKLRLVGTAYFNRLEDLTKEDKGPMDPTKVQPATMFQNAFQVTLDKGTMRLTAKNQGIKEGIKPLGNPDPNVDVAKMSNDELDDYLLTQRIEYQKFRPLLELMFNDLKITTVIHLPGEVAEVKGFKKDDNRTVSQSFEGKAFVDLFKKLVMMDRDSFKKLAQSNNEKDLLALLGPLANLGDPDITVTKLGAAQFDYDKEVAAARAAYPALRKYLGLDASIKLPGD